MTLPGPYGLTVGKDRYFLNLIGAALPPNPKELGIRAIENMKQIIDAIEELKMKLNHKDEILDEVHEALIELKDKLCSCIDKEDVKKIITMLEDL